ncbi:c-Myc-binding protein homolog [Topomyia yanbarensis]|uniref:c-Myc-binding protein homolog n=1 Tax=Topomyia yanbarensis TaxID=2498891 RepID=UPI00273B66F0|nr:c-Myc-binding protein homolog [Topomyia yanbarensis]
MSSFKPIDGSKEDFRKYLDRKGVMDAITKVLVKCNSDRPENALEYLLDNLGERLKDKDVIARLESELIDARKEIEVLKHDIVSLRAKCTATDISTTHDSMRDQTHNGPSLQIEQNKSKEESLEEKEIPETAEKVLDLVQSCSDASGLQ